MKIIFTSDIHLEMVNENNLIEFIDSINNEKSDLLLLGGDISNSKDIKEHLSFLDKKIKTNICFILGNHDFYGNSIYNVEKQIEVFVDGLDKMQYLNNINFIEINPTTCLIGINGWADGMYGDYNLSDVMLNDYFKIFDFISLDKKQRFLKLKELGNYYSEILKEKLNKITNNIKNILILTHVPPFKESCVYNNMPTNDSFLPHFSCKSFGDIILEYVKNNNKNITVLCGHTHGYCETNISDNIKVINSGAQYGKPKIQKIIVI